MRPAGLAQGRLDLGRDLAVDGGQNRTISSQNGGAFPRARPGPIRRRTLSPRGRNNRFRPRMVNMGPRRWLGFAEAERGWGQASREPASGDRGARRQPRKRLQIRRSAASRSSSRAAAHRRPDCCTRPSRCGRAEQRRSRRGARLGFGGGGRVEFTISIAATDFARGFAAPTARRGKGWMEEHVQATDGIVRWPQASRTARPSALGENGLALGYPPCD